MSLARKESIFLEQPLRPEPLVVAIEQHVSKEEVQFSRNPQYLARCIKQQMAAKIANFIVNNAQLLSDDDIISQGELVRFEFTINDRGAYRNWLPFERSEGRSEGRKQAISQMPYGMAPSEQDEL